MKKIIDSCSSLYPITVCRECGNIAAAKANTTKLLLSTYYNGYCGVCGKKTAVTEPRDFGYPPFEIDLDDIKARDEVEDKVSPEAKVDNMFIGEDVKGDLSDHSLINHQAIVFCDIDGLFADCSHRLPHLKDKKYEKFYGANMADDIPAGLSTAATIAFLAGIGFLYKTVRVRFLTGRPYCTRTLTAMWLRQNFPILFEEYVVFDDDAILCRDDNDWRPAPEVKMDLVKKYFENNTKSQNAGDSCSLDFVRGEFDTFILDDDPNVIKHFNDKFHDIMASEFGCNYMDCHPILMSPARFSNSVPSKLPVE